MAFIGIKLALLVICFITFFCSSDVNALKCKFCGGKEPVDLAKCESVSCEPKQVCSKSLLKTTTEKNSTADVGTVVRVCVNPTGLDVKVGSCGDYIESKRDRTNELYVCLCDSDNCNSAKSFHNWTPISFIIWLGLFLIVGAFTGQQ